VAAFSLNAGDNCPLVKLSLVCLAGWCGFIQGGCVESCLVRFCPVIHPTNDSTSAVIVSPLSIPSIRITVSDGRPWELLPLSTSCSASADGC
jgi:hypothetical protein